MQTTPSTEPRSTARRGWRRGLVSTALVLVVAWVFYDRDRAAAPASPAPALPRRALPAATDLSAPTQARPRLLVIPSPSPQTAADDVVGRLRQACAERVAVVSGDEQVAQALGIKSLPAFVLYSATGAEIKRCSGPDGLAQLATELNALGVSTPGSAAEGTR